MNSFKPIYNDKCKMLILGSFPGAKSLENGFYYMDNRNCFWELMDEITGEGFFNEKKVDYLCKKDESITKEMEDKLLSYGIAVGDVIAECERVGSLDSDIETDSIEINDLKKMCETVDLILINGKKKRGNQHIVYSKRITQGI